MSLRVQQRPVSPAASQARSVAPEERQRLQVLTPPQGVSCPDFPVFCWPGGPSPFLSEHASRIPREFPVWKKPARIWALDRTREIAGKRCSETEQGGQGAPQAMWVLILLWVWGAQQVLCCVPAEGKHFLTGSHLPSAPCRCTSALSPVGAQAHVPIPIPRAARRP